MSQCRTGDDRQAEGGGKDSAEQPYVQVDATVPLDSRVTAVPMSAHVGTLAAGHRQKLTEIFHNALQFALIVLPRSAKFGIEAVTARPIHRLRKVAGFRRHPAGIGIHDATVLPTAR